PRSILRCLTRLHDKVDTLPRHEVACAAIDKVKTLMVSTDTTRLAEEPQVLHQLIDDLQLGVNSIHDAIRETWFAGVDSPAPIVAD
ncbi:MAG: alpha-E domain-containing protein, partial [Rhodocyclaceae bacterium]|nr:alpha-E domain-containing protein [Rhodocyclaceae bacterium]